MDVKRKRPRRRRKKNATAVFILLATTMFAFTLSAILLFSYLSEKNKTKQAMAEIENMENTLFSQMEVDNFIEKAKQELLDKAGVEKDTAKREEITKDDLEVIQQLAIWYFASTNEKYHFEPENFPSIIRGIKSSVKKYANDNKIIFEWHKRYHDRIIRNHNEMNNIAEYIENNPIKWDLR